MLKIVGLQHIILCNLIYSKSDSIKHNNFTVNNDSLSLIKCIPKNTFLKKGNISVKYIISDTTYDIQIKISKVSKKLGYHFDCNAPLSIVPHFEWANKNILSLKRSCGTFCSINYFYQISGNKLFEFERENVICFEKNKNLIAYLATDGINSIVVEKLGTKYKKTFKLDLTVNCDSIIECISEATFIGNNLVLKYLVLKEGKEIETKKVFNID